MTERTALGLIYIGSIGLTGVVMVVLWLLGVPTEVVSLVWVLGLIAGATGVSRVTMHYAPTRRHRDD